MQATWLTSLGVLLNTRLIHQNVLAPTHSVAAGSSAFAVPAGSLMSPGRCGALRTDRRRSLRVRRPPRGDVTHALVDPVRPVAGRTGGLIASSSGSLPSWTNRHRPH